MEVRVTSQSQTHRLRERMEEAAVGHGDVVRVDVRSVRVSATAGARVGEVFFCNMEPLTVRQRQAGGDGARLPDTVELDATLEVPGPGLYDLLNARLSSNGVIRIEADADTRVVIAAVQTNASRTSWPDYRVAAGAPAL